MPTHLASFGVAHHEYSVRHEIFLRYLLPALSASFIGAAKLFLAINEVSMNRLVSRNSGILDRCGKNTIQ